MARELRSGNLYSRCYSQQKGLKIINAPEPFQSDPAGMRKRQGVAPVGQYAKITDRGRMPQPIEITLTGTIHKDPETGYFISVCNELNICTNAPTLEETILRTFEMIDSYFVAAKQIGLLEKTLADLCVPNPAPAGAMVRSRFAVSGAHSYSVEEAHSLAL